MVEGVKTDENEREIWVEESRVFLGQDNIIYSDFAGEFDAETATAIGEATIKLANYVEGKAKIVNDINKVKKPTPEARSILQEYIIREKIGKVAIFGLHPVARVIASFFLGVTRKKDVKYFKTKEEALAWLER